MRTNEEIIDQINTLKDRDLFGFETSDLIMRLPFNDAKQYLKPDAEESEWEPSPKDDNSIKEEMESYMSFAWDKANNCRGISAGRSMAHYKSWIWLLGDDLGDLTNYQYYGKDNLVKICEHYGWDHEQHDDGIRSNSEY